MEVLLFILIGVFVPLCWVAVAALISAILEVSDRWK